MKILFVAPLASIHAQRWISFFTSKGHEIQIIDSQNTGLKEFAGARVHGIPWSSSSHHSYTIKLLSSAVKLPSFLKAFRRVLNNFKPHVVHLHWITGPHAYALATTISDSSLIATPWGSDILILPKESWLHRFIVQKVIQKAIKFCCDAQHLSTALQNYGAPKDAIDIIYFGTDTKLFSPTAKDTQLAEEMGFPTGTSLILSNRPLQAIYDVATLIKAIPQTVDRVPSCGFIIVGDGKEKSSLEKMVQDLGVTELVRFVGRLSDADMVRFTASASIYVSTSLSDGGLAASTAEAMACAVPVVITDFGENAHWLDNSKAGCTFEMKNAAQLADKLITLLENETSQMKMGSHGRKIILERNDYYKEMSRVEMVYEQLFHSASTENN